MRIVVVGAGIIGLTTALALRRSGHEVLVLDSHASAAQGCSGGNGGFLAPTHCAPWAAPGVPWMALKSWRAPDGPMRLRPPANWRQARWLLRMLKECTADRFHVNRSRMLALGQYSARCQDEVDRFLPLSYSRHKRGVLQLSRSAQSAEALRAKARALSEQGIEAYWRSEQDVRALEPGLHPALPDLYGALHVLHEGSGQCERYCELLAAALEKMGVTMGWRSRVRAIDVAAAKAGAGARVTGVWTESGRVSGDAFVIAAGPDLPQLLNPWLDVPICPVKGHSMTVAADAAGLAPQHAVIDERSMLAIAPFDSAVRVAGFADVVGHDLRLDPGRVAQLKKGFAALYPGLPTDSACPMWAGLRPMTPDGTPIVGATSIQGLYLNCGHGTYGWTLSFGSAQLLADQINQVTPSLSPSDYALARYAV